MSGWLERWLLQRWYDGVSPGMLLSVLAWLYGTALRVNGLLYRCGMRRVHRLSVPVIVVGNLVAGGAGKTPLTIALAQSLANQGWRPGIVSRGYGRDSQEPVSVTPTMPPEMCGDEPLLIARRTGLPVFVDSDRVAAARRAIAAGCSVIIADDGLQHRRLGRDIEIEVLDGQRRYGNACLIPAGPLREPIGRAVDFRVVTAGASRSGEWSMQLALDALFSMDGQERKPLEKFAGKQVHAVAGIGNPGRFFSALRAAGLELVEHPFPDHHVFEQEDFQFQPSLPVLMTEKDAMKCGELTLHNAWGVPVSAQLSAEFFVAVSDRLAQWSPVHDVP